MKILIADDEALWANLIRGIFEGHKYQVVVTLKGSEVPDLAEKENVDLILLDVNFPDTNGFIVCEKLKTNPATRSIPVVLLTAQSDPSDLKSGLEMGASDYVEKHSSSLELLARVQSLLRRRERFKYFDRYESIFMNSPICTSLIWENKIKFANNAYIKALGYENLEELNEMDINNLVAEDDIPLFTSIHDQVLETNSTEYFNFKGKMKNGSPIQFEASMNKIQINADFAILVNCKITRIL